MYHFSVVVDSFLQSSEAHVGIIGGCPEFLEKRDIRKVRAYLEVWEIGHFGKCTSAQQFKKKITFIRIRGNAEILERQDIGKIQPTFVIMGPVALGPIWPTIVPIGPMRSIGLFA